MSTTAKTTPASAEPDIYATLVRGRVYVLGEVTFEQGTPRKVSAQTRDWLGVHAVDRVTVEGYPEERQKFVFRADDTKPAIPVRIRTRR